MNVKYSLKRKWSWCQICCPLQWRHHELDGVSNHQHHDCLFNCLFRRRSKKTSKLRVTGLCAGNSPGTGKCFHFRTSSCRWWYRRLSWWQHTVPQVTAKLASWQLLVVITGSGRMACSFKYNPNSDAQYVLLTTTDIWMQINLVTSCNLYCRENHRDSDY